MSAKARARDNDCANVVIGVDFAKGILYLGPHLASIGIEPVRTIKRDDQCRALGFASDEAVCGILLIHGIPLPFVSCISKGSTRLRAVKL